MVADVAPPITVGVLTFQRAAQLDHCLRSLCHLDPRSPAFEIVVVDNDPAASARVQVAELRNASDIPIRYLHEPRPGVAAARNRVLDDPARADVVAFIDDDEWAEPDWLVQLYSGYLNNGGGVVQGRVISVLDGGGPGWASAKGGPFERVGTPHGTRQYTGNAGNVIFDASPGTLRSARFNESYGLTGGEDTEFFARLARSGVIVTSIPQAIVYETVPLQRQTVRWVVRRSFRTSAVWARIQREVIAERNWAARRILAAVRDFALGVATIALGAVTWSSNRLVRGLQVLARGAGTVSGLVGFNIQEYGRAL